MPKSLKTYNSPLNFLRAIVGSEKVLVEMDNRVFARVSVPEISQDSGEVGLLSAKKFHNVLNTKLVEVDATLASTNLEERLQYIAKEGVRDGYHFSDVFGAQGAVLVVSAHGLGNGGGEEAIGNCLRVRVCEIDFSEIVNQGCLKGLVEPAERASVRLGFHQSVRCVSDAPSQGGKNLGEGISGADDMANAMPERRAPLGTPGRMICGLGWPVKFSLQRGGDMFEFKGRVGPVPAKDPKGRQIGALLVKMGEGDLTLIRGLLAEG